jgi:hypothetical protein
MKPADFTEKQVIEKRLSDAFKEYFALLDRVVVEAPFIRVSVSAEKKRKRHYPVFLHEDSPIVLPDLPGVYFVYRKGEDLPFYCGESASLSQRLTYHFSDCADAIRNSTLKKQFDVERRTLAAMSDMLLLKIVEVPVGRNDVEDYFQTKFKINTKRDRKKG